MGSTENSLVFRNSHALQKLRLNDQSACLGEVETGSVNLFPAEDEEEVVAQKIEENTEGVQEPKLPYIEKARQLAAGSTVLEDS